jgi:long-subunit acyl-CoA synthetase (AMP-forming)
MKRLTICTLNPENYLHYLDSHSVVLISPKLDQQRQMDLIARSNSSVIVTDLGHQTADSMSEYEGEQLVLTTSGTDGFPTFHSFSKNQLDQKIESIIRWFDITDKDHYVSFMPLWHVAGLGVYLACKKVGAKISFINISNLKKIPDLNPSFLVGSPSILKVLANLRWKNLRYVRSTTEPLSVDLYWQFLHAFGCPVIENHGMTEALGICISNPLNGEQRPGSVGLPVDLEIKIQKGVLYLQGPTFSTPGWVDTGDLAEFDEKGYVRILGRKKDVIIVRGNKFFPSQIEKIIKDLLPDIKNIAVFGNNTINAVYEGECDRARLTSILRKCCQNYMPNFVQQVHSIPLSSNGKLSRNFLIQTYLS